MHNFGMASAKFASIRIGPLFAILKHRCKLALRCRNGLGEVGFWVTSENGVSVADGQRPAQEDGSLLLLVSLITHFEIGRLCAARHSKALNLEEFSRLLTESEILGSAGHSS